LRDAVAALQTELYQKKGPNNADQDSVLKGMPNMPFDKDNFDPAKLNEYMQKMGIDPNQFKEPDAPTECANDNLD
jgi:hypothetical protein